MKQNESHLGRKQHNLSGVNLGDLNSKRIRKLSAREIEANTGLNYLNSKRICKLFPE